MNSATNNKLCYWSWDLFTARQSQEEKKTSWGTSVSEFLSVSIYPATKLLSRYAIHGKAAEVEGSSAAVKTEHLYGVLTSNP